VRFHKGPAGWGLQGWGVGEKKRENPAQGGSRKGCGAWGRGEGPTALVWTPKEH